MTDHGGQLPFELHDHPSEALYTRIRAAVDATPASTVSTHVRLSVALAALPFIAAAVLVVAARIVYDRPVLRLFAAAALVTPICAAIVLGAPLEATPDSTSWSIDI